MAIHDLIDQDGRLFAFEVDNSRLGRKKICKILTSIPGIQILRKPIFMSEFREEVFCEFELNGLKFEVWEPFGDNSRYWIGPEPVLTTEQIKTVREAFVPHC